MADEPQRESSWSQATKEHAQLVDLVRTLVREYHDLTGNWPTNGWLLQKIGLAP